MGPTLDAMKAEGAEYGGRILDYELVLSEYFKSLPKATGTKTIGNQHRGKVGKIDSGVDFTKSDKMQAVSELGFSQKEVERIQQLTPEAIEQAKAVARENNDIPTRSLALQIAKQGGDRKSSNIKTKFFRFDSFTDDTKEKIGVSKRTV